MVKYYKDFYGSTAKISERKDGQTVLTMRNAYGKGVTVRTYKNRRNAIQAMTKEGDAWREQEA